MAEKIIEKVIRRSTREEALERIVKSPVKNVHDGEIRGWAEGELASIREASDVAPDEELEKAAFDKHGWPREQEDIRVEDPVLFVKRVAAAYKDAMNYPEYVGITIGAEVESLRGASGSDSYEFKADFGERVGLRDKKVYRTEFVFVYQHSQEDGKFDETAFVNEQLTEIADLLGKEAGFDRDIMDISENYLIIRTSDKE